MNILIFGAGAVGSMFGAFLARGGHKVTLLGRVGHLDAVAKGGLRVRGIWGEFRVKDLELFRSVEEMVGMTSTFDLIFLTVKSFDTEEAVSELAPLLSPKTTLVSFQNGLGNVETILKTVKPEQFLVGRIITGVELTPGELEITVSADAMALGAVPGAVPQLSAEKLSEVLRSSGIPTRAVSDIMARIWAKVIYNCALNAPCSLLEIPYGKILDHSETRRLMTRIVEECYLVAKGHVELDPPNASEYVDLLVGELIPKTAAHYPSMLRDLKKARPTEIGALNGAIVARGRASGIPTPENEHVLEEIRRKEKTLLRK